MWRTAAVIAGASVAAGSVESITPIRERLIILKEGCSYDVLVVGGGITSMAIAERLAGSNQSVLVAIEYGNRHSGDGCGLWDSTMLEDSSTRLICRLGLLPEHVKRVSPSKFAAEPWISWLAYAFSAQCSGAVVSEARKWLILPWFNKYVVVSTCRNIAFVDTIVETSSAVPVKPMFLVSPTPKCQNPTIYPHVCLSESSMSKSPVVDAGTPSCPNIELINKSRLRVSGIAGANLLSASIVATEIVNLYFYKIRGIHPPNASFVNSSMILPSLVELGKDFRGQGDGSVCIFGKLYPVSHPLSRYALENFPQSSLI